MSGETKISCLKSSIEKLQIKAEKESAILNCLVDSAELKDNESVITEVLFDYIDGSKALLDKVWAQAIEIEKAIETVKTVA